VAVLIRPRAWGQTKPGPGATIDWGHPFATAIEFAHVHPWTSRPTLLPADSPVSAIGTPTFGAQGTILTQATGVAYADSDRWDKMYQANGYTLAAIYASRSSASDETHFLTRDDAGGSGLTGATGSGRVWQFRLDNGTTARFVAFNDAGSVAQPTAASAGRDGKPHMLVASMDWSATTNNVALALDGIIRGTGSLSGAHTTGRTTNLVTVGGGAGSSTEVVATYAWSRRLTAEEIAWLYAEPFAFFAPPASRLSVFALGGGPPTITGTGALVGGASALAGAGTLTITGAGALVGGAATLAGAGTETIVGTGSLTGGAAVLSGAGTLTIGGTGVLTARAGVLAGVGTHTAPTVPNIPGTTTGTFAPTGQTTATFAPTGTTTGVQGP